ncbi:methyltransferase domain-containing protein [Lentilactobacillus farraginis]|uniref:23S rRNA methyltransferase A n=1 Tax=Lentilactobacillus farraginis DSM 18382 = JCM 14108 TaxID=1423743 RepID=X0QB09_9LACO|nr:methyltransferase domain-containing protein [Lentilactobacillus farraginis]KRM00997.1 23S rRNA methyltransferase A [Lentilactobacillus farraginis DSM 18382 = JCM 14108]GAF35795.1 ribosomal RNA large subunit methyltransferase A [Lentilactobacillus farraginis DSM 18382 = JCM 14108]
MKKIEMGTAFVSRHLALFQCPVCGQPFKSVAQNQLICPAQHAFDFSKKGTLFFLTKAANNEYDSQMLMARQRLLQAGLFDGIIQAIGASLAAEPETILDVGCGEGTPLARLLERRHSNDVAIGFDISKDGINLATRYGNPNTFFCVADLARLPFNQKVFSSVIDLFSPSSYREFNRVIKPGGRLIKVIPNGGYLKELRQLLYGHDQPNSSYSNQNVLALFKKHYPSSSVQSLTYRFPLPKELRRDMMIMTPLHWGRGQRLLSTSQLDGLTEITVDVSILINHF